MEPKKRNKQNFHLKKNVREKIIEREQFPGHIAAIR